MRLSTTRSAAIAVALHVLVILWAATIADSGVIDATFGERHGLFSPATGERL